MRRKSCGNSGTWNGKSSGTNGAAFTECQQDKGDQKTWAGAEVQALYRMSGVDITHIDAIGVETVEVVLSEYGPDLSRFPTEKQFVSHVTLAPHVPTSGGKPLRKRKRNSASTRVAAALRMAALSLRHSQTALGAYYRKMAQWLGGDIAVFATARKLATLICRLLRWGQPYVDEGAKAYETRYRPQRIGRLAATAKQLGCQLAPMLESA